MSDKTVMDGITSGSEAIFKSGPALSESTHRGQAWSTYLLGAITNLNHANLWPCMVTMDDHHLIHSVGAIKRLSQPNYWGEISF